LGEFLTPQWAETPRFIGSPEYTARALVCSRTEPGTPTPELHPGRSSTSVPSSASEPHSMSHSIPHSIQNPALWPQAQDVAPLASYESLPS